MMKNEALERARQYRRSGVDTAKDGSHTYHYSEIADAFIEYENAVKAEREKAGKLIRDMRETLALWESAFWPMGRTEQLIAQADEYEREKAKP